MFRFIDSRRFLNSSEDKLANQLANRTKENMGPSRRINMGM